MVAMSLLRPALSHGVRTAMLRGSLFVSRTTSPHISKGATRPMSSHNRMVIKPSRFEWERWKDDLIFYLFLGFLPMGAVIIASNLFIGPSELADIPEGYEPMPWEYYKGPIQRFFMRYIYEPPELVYERTLHLLWLEGEKRKMRMLEKKVKALMHDRQDYKGWYYVPVDKSRLERALEAQKEWHDVVGTRIV